MDGGRHSSFTPPLPPTSEDGRLDWLRLLRSRRVGIATFYRLLSDHGSARAALRALPQIARDAGVEGYTPCPAPVIYAELRAAREIGARLLLVGSPDYPAALLTLDDPPPALWALGDLSLAARPGIAVVGARNASSLGLRMARRLGQDLGQADQVVVSGLARGIDAAAHDGALGTGTIAVLGGGLDVVYPQENHDLYHKIAAQGLLLSEQPMGTAPRAGMFLRRNRLIAALGRAVVVVEATAKSGSLGTARDALDLGRDVMAVPGHPLDPRAAGGNILIRDGALLVRSAQDVLEALPAPSEAAQPPKPAPSDPAPPRQPKEPRSAKDTAALHAQILDRLGPSPTPEEHMAKQMRTPFGRIARALTDMEMAGQIMRHPGGFWSRSG